MNLTSNNNNLVRLTGDVMLECLTGLKNQPTSFAVNVGGRRT